MSYQIDVRNFVRGPETWVKDDREGYRLYVVEDLQSGGPSDTYAITKYDWNNREVGQIVSIGRGEFEAVTPNKEAVNAEMEERGVTPFTDKQWTLVQSRYMEMVKRGMRDSVMDADLQVYENTLYYEIDDFNAALQYYVDNIYKKLDRYEEAKDNEDQRMYGSYEEANEKYDRLGDDQYHNLNALTAGIDPPHADKVPYAQHCQCVATLNIDPLDDWELRALELLHNGVLVNKPALAKTKALLEEGLSQADIADKLGKSASTVSRQATQIEVWENRAEWQSRQ